MSVHIIYKPVPFIHHQQFFVGRFSQSSKPAQGMGQHQAHGGPDLTEIFIREPVEERQEQTEGTPEPCNIRKFPERGGTRHGAGFNKRRKVS